MAKRGSFGYTVNYQGTSDVDGHYLYLQANWEVESVDGVTNSSTLRVTYTCKSSCTATLHHDYSTYQLNDNNFHTIGEHDSSTENYDVELPANTPVTIYSGTVNVPHSSTSAQSFSLGWRLYGNVRVNYEYVAQNLRSGIDTGPQYFVLDAIVRSAFIESILDGLTTCTDEDPLKMLYNNPMKNEATLLQAGISVSNGAEMEVPYRSISKTGTVYTFNLTTSEWAAIYAKTLDKKVTTCPIRSYLKSTVPVLNGSSTETRVDYKDATMNFINYLPTMNPVLKDINPVTVNITGNENVFVRHASNVQFNLNASAKKQAKLTNYYAANGDNTVFATSGVLEAVTGNDFNMQVFDSRGFYAAVQETHNVTAGNWIEYVPLTCAVKNGLLDANGNLVVTISGKYFGGSFGAVDNSLHLEYNIRKSGDVDVWTPVYVSNVPTDSNNNYTYSFTISDLDYTDRYLLTVRATDQINQEGSITETIIGAVPVFDWGKNDFAFYVPVTINGASVPSIVEQDTYSGWTYRKWTDGTAECWKNLTIDNVNISNSFAGGWYASGNLESTNLTFPFTFKEQPSVTVSTLPTGTSWAIVFPGSTAGNTTQTGSFQLLGTSSTTAKSYILSYQVKGRWK